jgi:cytochrome c1
MVRSALACALLILAGVSGIAGQAGRTAVYTAEQAARGKVSERDNAMAAGKGFGACSDCHGEGLTGRVGDPDERPAVASLKPGVQAEIAKNGGRIPDLVGPRFRARWANRSVKDLTVNFKDRFGLSEETRLDILAYILSENGYRAGRESLTMATDVPMRLLAGSGAP